MTTKQIRTICTLNDECHALLEMATDRLGLSARAYNRILKVSRTIADLDRIFSIDNSRAMNDDERRNTLKP